MNSASGRRQPVKERSLNFQRGCPCVCFSRIGLGQGGGRYFGGSSILSGLHKPASTSKRPSSIPLGNTVGCRQWSDFLFQSTGSVEPSPSPSPGSLSAALNIAAAAAAANVTVTVTVILTVDNWLILCFSLRVAWSRPPLPPPGPCPPPSTLPPPPPPTVYPKSAHLSRIGESVIFFM